MGTDDASPQSRRLGSFEVVRELGQGGMGVVTLARQPALDRLVVLKKVRRDMLADPSMAERFQREARAAAAVHHQNVVAVYDCFSARGDDYIAQEFVDGVDLREVLQRARPLPPRVAALIALEVVRGLEEIHAQGIVHRDLKPGNILLGCGGEVKIADFGIALEGKADGLTRPGTMMGSLPYMAPEQMLGERVDYRCDLFLFGLLFYEMVAGAPPFVRSAEEDSADTLLERMQKGHFESPRSRAPKVPRYVVRLIRSCLRAKPSRRVASATVARRRLERWVGHVSPADCRSAIAAFLWERDIIEASEERTRRRPGARSRSGASWTRPRWLAPAASVGLLGAIALGATTGGFGYFSREANGAASPPSATMASAPLSGPGRHQAAPWPAGLGPTPRSARRMEAPPEVRRVIEGKPATEAAAPPPDPGRVRFVAWPWAEVTAGDGTRVLTPRAEPVAMRPGRHRIVFEHPRFGRAEYDIDLGSGEELTLRHVFSEAPAP